MFTTDKKILENFYTEKRIWQLVPGIERTKRGRLFCTFYSGRCTETLGNYCVVLRSDDDGETWTEPICAACNGQMKRCFDSVLWIDPKGRLWFTWASGHRYSVYGVICENPDADELVWSEEFYIGEGVMMNKPTVLSTGEWLFPVALWDYWYTEPTFNQIKRYGDLFLEEYLEKQEAYSGANVYKSSDCGKTIRFAGGSRRIAERSHDEHMIFEKNDGTLVMFTRTKYGISRSYSYDKGVTWTAAEKSGLTGPNSRFHVRRLRSGRLLLVNHDNYTGRNNLTAFLSEDDGETWPYKLLLDERSEVSYPDMTESDDGFLYIVYDRERGAYKDTEAEALASAREILFAKITEDDIINGEVRSKGSFLKKIISKLGDYKGNELDLYTGRPQKIEPREFTDTVMRLEKREDLLKYIFVYYPVSFSELNTDEIKKTDELINCVRRCLNNDGELRVALMTLTEFLCALPHKTDFSGGEAYVNALMKYVRENFARNIDVGALAYKIGISENYLCYMFLKKIGMSLWEYREQCRFSNAKKLLISTEKSIGEICADCGFDESVNFVRMFTETEGLTPIEYRIAHKN